MKRAWLFFVPFVVLTGCHIASHWTEDDHLVGDVWAVTFLGCLLCVPVLARKKLWIGYVALLYPFVLLVLHLAFDWGSLSLG